MDNSKLSLHLSFNDVLFVLTVNNSKYKEDIKTLMGKIIILNNYVEIDLNRLSHILSYMGINRLNIFCIDNVEGMNKTIIKEPAEILFIELSVAEFNKFLNDPKENFMDYNLNSLYIVRNSNFYDIKLLINQINNYSVNIGRGGGQKSHIVSPMEFRLSSYLMAMFNFNFKKMCDLNAFNKLDKRRYLPYIEKKSK